MAFRPPRVFLIDLDSDCWSWAVPARGTLGLAGALCSVKFQLGTVKEERFGGCRDSPLDEEPAMISLDLYRPCKRV